jgi:hypothetical protein
MATLIGIHLPYFFGAYGHDLAPNLRLGTGPEEVDPRLIHRALLTAHEAGFQAVHLWLCEAGEGVVTEADSITGVHPVLIESVAIIQECASLCGLRLYWTLLDGHSRQRSGDTLCSEILNLSDRTAQFAERVAGPLVRRFDPHLTVAVEVANEPAALVAEHPDGRDGSRVEWQSLGRAIETIADAIRAEHSATLVTAGSQLAALPLLWRSARGLTAIDVHVEPDSELPSRAEVSAALPAPLADSIPLISGCVGETAATTEVARQDYRAVFIEGVTV